MLNNLQTEVDWWHSRFDSLGQWSIKYMEDGKNFCTTRYNIEEKRAVIYACDIDQEDSYILHEVLKIAFIESRLSAAHADKFLEDLTTLILDRSLR
jgi:hypothetical protein